MTKTTEKKFKRGELKAAMEDFSNRINSAWNKQVEGIIECGKVLIEAKGVLGHGRWGAMFKAPFFSSLLPFGQGTAGALMKIAEHPVLSNSQFVANLPPSWGTLHVLSQIDSDRLISLIDKGQVHADMTRQDASQLGVFVVQRVPKTLSQLQEVFDRYDDPYDLYDELTRTADWVNTVVFLDKVAGYMRDLAEAQKKWQEDHHRVVPGQIPPERREEVEANLKKFEEESLEGSSVAQEIKKEREAAQHRDAAE